jgi:hypothetical protein
LLDQDAGGGGGDGEQGFLGLDLDDLLFRRDLGADLRQPRHHRGFRGGFAELGHAHGQLHPRTPPFPAPLR